MAGRQPGSAAASGGGGSVGAQAPARPATSTQRRSSRARSEDPGEVDQMMATQVQGGAAAPPPDLLGSQTDTGPLTQPPRGRSDRRPGVDPADVRRVLVSAGAAAAAAPRPRETFTPGTGERIVRQGEPAKRPRQLLSPLMENAEAAPAGTARRASGKGARVNPEDMEEDSDEVRKNKWVEFARGSPARLCSCRYPVLLPSTHIFRFLLCRRRTRPPPEFFGAARRGAAGRLPQCRSRNARLPSSWRRFLISR